FELRAAGLTLAGQRVDGELRSASGLVSGELSAGPLRLSARNGELRASGTLAGYSLRGSGRLRLPSTLSDLDLTLDGPLLSARASGSGADLHGSVLLKAQTFSAQGGASASISPLAGLPAQVLPLRASLFPLAADVGGLKYSPSGWGGQARLRYVLGGVAGTARLSGAGRELSVVAAGPASGTVRLLPALGGTLSTPLRPLIAPQLAGLAPSLRAALQPGTLRAALTPGGARLSLDGARALGQPLGLEGWLDWTGGLRASALLTQPGSRVPLSYRNGVLSVRGGVLDATIFTPLLGTRQPVSGQVGLDLTLPLASGSGPLLDRAAADLRLDLSSGGQSARGRARLSGGRLSADLTSSLGGQALRLSGPLYPQADAALSFAGLRASLRGDLRERATLDVHGQYGGKAVRLSAQGGLNVAGVSLGGTVAGLRLDLLAEPSSAKALSLRDWQVSGTFSAPDLYALNGPPGT
ncbi:MAG: translocation/assembly module TamB domain-containing protein, partial [Deinococcus sp.]